MFEWLGDVPWCWLTIFALALCAGISWIVAARSKK